MNVLFLTIGQIQSLKGASVHIDIIKALKAKGHNVTVLATSEKRLGKETEFVVEDGVEILRLKVGNLTKCSIIEKGINTVLIERNFIRAIKKYFAKYNFDLVIYNTPPITFAGAVRYCKKKFGCKSYLMLKDIFPQNAVDLNVMSKTGISGLLYKMFRKKEISLYKASDRIGCMSMANVRFLLENNDYIKKEKVEIFPNAVYDTQKIEGDKAIFDKLGLDKKKLTFVYGGNLGKPQGLDFLSKAIKACDGIDEVQFVIVGSGNNKIQFYESLKDANNCKCMEHLPHDDYEALCAACDIGMIALDHRFTIPNYPSRILSYMKCGKPMLACTDKVTDIKELLEEEANCGKWCYSDDVDGFVNCVNWFAKNREQMSLLGQNSYDYLKQNFTTDICIDRLEKFAEQQ